MSLEIERKFLVASDAYRAEATECVEIMQGYLSTRPEATVRVRLWGSRGYITVKGLTTGCVRHEWEYEIPAADARAMLENLCGTTVLAKRRWLVPHAGLVWEVDEFTGRHAPLVLAEVELTSPDQPLSLPPWLGPEVTADPRYYNSTLAAQ